MQHTPLVKVCGLTSAEAVTAAAGASHVGFIFYPPSPRALAPAAAAALRAKVAPGTQIVAVFVDPCDSAIEAVITTLAPDLLQLHGKESPQRVAAVRQRFGVPVMKAVRVSDARDIGAARHYEGIVDSLLFDAKPPAGAIGMLPGGNGLAFDWSLLAGYDGDTPWFLSGGLDRQNLAQAIRASGARAVDVSSGVEDRPGVKNIAKIHAFLAAAGRRGSQPA